MPRRRLASIFLALVLALSSAACGDVDLFGGSGGGDDPEAFVTMSMVPGPPEPTPGEFVDVSIRIDNAQNVVSTPFKLRFDDTILRFDQAGSALGPFLQQDGNLVVFIATPDSQDPGVVAVGISALGETDGVSGDGDLCMLRFEVLPQAGTGATSIIPFDAFVFSPGLEEQTLLFGELELTVY